MMVSKIAVIAFVAIVACPILLGFGMNLEQNTHTEYKTTNNSIDVTTLLKDGASYSMASADIYRLNTEFVTAYDGDWIIPIYEKSMSDSGSFPLKCVYASGWAGGWWDFRNDDILYMLFKYDPTGGQSVMMDIYSNGTLNHTINNVLSFYYQKSTDSFTLTYYDLDIELVEDTVLQGGNYTDLEIRLSGMASVPVYWGTQIPGSYNEYVDFSAGFRLYGVATYPLIKLPQYTQSILMTINLNSITAANADLQIDHGYGIIHLQKRTVGGVVAWSCTTNNGTEQLYYDSSRIDNTYQFYAEYTGKYQSDNHIYYKSHNELRYIGSWPTLIGEASAYFTYEYDTERSKELYETDYGMERVRIYDTNTNLDYNVSPIIRMDAARFSAFQYYVIQDKVYDPGSFRTNPSTKLVDIGKYGDYLTFGGVRFDVKDGNITMGTHEISVKKIVFQSIPTDGGYDNKIGDVVISTTPNPSTITFGGNWGATVITDSMQSSTYSSMDWIPGQFGWDGIDQNFLIVGLVTCLGVFVALGIYARKRGTGGLIPLMIITGCAAAVFFIML